jgi:hypothetical protein
VEEIRNMYKTVVGKPEGKRALGGARSRLEDNIKMDLKDKMWEGVNWIHLAQDRDQWRILVNTFMNSWVL